MNNKKRQSGLKLFTTSQKFRNTLPNWNKKSSCKRMHVESNSNSDKQLSDKLKRLESARMLRRGARSLISYATVLLWAVWMVDILDGLSRQSASK